MQVSTALSTFNILEIMDPQMTAEDTTEIEQSEVIIRRMLQTNWDLENDNHESAMSKLARVLGENYLERRDEVIHISRKKGNADVEH